ncbi:hypothetical protein P9112_002247 [Eukaryota sp. TZLM1-RC]
MTDTELVSRRYSLVSGPNCTYILTDSKVYLIGHCSFSNSVHNDGERSILHNVSHMFCLNDTFLPHILVTTCEGHVFAAGCGFSTDDSLTHIPFPQEIRSTCSSFFNIFAVSIKNDVFVFQRGHVSKLSLSNVIMADCDYHTAAFLTNEGSVYTMNLSTGLVTVVRVPFIYQICVCCSLVFAIDLKQRVWCWDSFNQKPQQLSNLGRVLYLEPRSSDGHLFLVDINGRLLVYDIDSNCGACKPKVVQQRINLQAVSVSSEYIIGISSNSKLKWKL